LWWIVVFAGVFGEFGASRWCFCGHVVVDWMDNVVCGRAVFGWVIFCRFSGFIFEIGRCDGTAETVLTHIPMPEYIG
jgi:hypothetical protein